MKLLFLFILAVPATAFASDPINAVIGDASWQGDPADVDEVTRIRAHLGYVEAMLRDADVSHLDPAQRTRRLEALDALASYREGGLFPRRTADAYEGRRPRFIDDRGVHCAVGQLIAATGHPELARRINDDFEYAYVPDIAAPELAEWADAYGFTSLELATIQPAYSPPPTSESTRARIEAMKDGITLECAREHEPPESFRIRVRGDSGGDAHPSARSNDPFVRCFMEKLGTLRAGAWDRQPSRYRFRMRIEVNAPQVQLERRLAALRVEGSATSCVPRPGPTPDRAFFNVRVGEHGARVGARTEPSNPEVERCLRDWLRERLADFGPGRWRLHARAPNLALGRTMTTERLQQALQAYAPHLATECFAHGAPERAQARVRVDVDQPLSITIEGGEVAWQECLREKLEERLRSNFSASRRLPDGSFERFFRADAAAEAEHAFEIETPEAREQRQVEERERREREMERYSL